MQVTRNVQKCQHHLRSCIQFWLHSKMLMITDFTFIKAHHRKFALVHIIPYSHCGTLALGHIMSLNWSSMLMWNDFMTPTPQPALTAQQPVEIHKVEKLRAMVTDMHPAPQCPCQPHSPSYAQDELLSDGFPPCREHKSSPDPPFHSSAGHFCYPSSTIQKDPRRPSKSGSSPLRLPSKGLRSKDICNTLRAGTICCAKVIIIPFLPVVILNTI